MQQLQKILLCYLLLATSSHYAMEKAVDKIEPAIECSHKQLFKAIKHNQLDRVTHIIETAPHLINSYEKYNRPMWHIVTPLHVATFYGHNKCMQILLDHAADPNALTQCESVNQTYALSPLHYACSAKGARLLLKHSSRHINQKNSRHITPLFGALSSRDRCHSKHTEVLYDVASVLLQHGADINKGFEKGNSPLYEAVDRKDHNLVDFLLRNNANPEKRHANGMTPFDRVCHDHYTYPNDHSPMIRVFEKYGMFALEQLPKHYNRTGDPFEYGCKLDAILPQLKHESPTAFQIVFDNMARLLKCAQRSHNIEIEKISTHAGVTYNEQGCFIKNVSKRYLEKRFGQEGMVNIKALINDRCKKALLLESMYLENIDSEYCPWRWQKFHRFVAKYPFVLYYDSAITVKMLFAAIKHKEHARSRCLDFLLCKGIDFRTFDRDGYPGYTALHQAVLFDNPDAIRLLMEMGIDFFQRDTTHKMTAMAYATHLKRNSCTQAFNEMLSTYVGRAEGIRNYKKFKKLIKHIPDINYVPYGQGRTLLHETASSFAPKEFTVSLIVAGANVNARDDNGKTPLNLVIVTGRSRKRLMHCLLENGALVNQRMLDDFRAEEPYLIETQALLQETYDNQQCCICFEHPEDLIDIPCSRRHRGNFMCKDCYPHMQGACPLCREKLDECAA